MTRRRKIVLVILAVLAAAIAAGYLYVFEMGGLERILNRQLASLLADQTGMDVRFERVAGDPFSGLTVDGIHIHFADSGGAVLDAVIQRVSVGYTWSNLWQRNYLFDYVHIDSASVRIVRDSTGRWPVPGGNTAVTSGESGTALPELFVDNLRLHGAGIVVIQRDDTLRVEGLELSLALKTVAETYAIDIDHLEFASADERFRLDAGGGRLTYTDRRLLFEDVTVLSNQARVKVEGNLDFRGETAGRLTFALDHIDLSRIQAYGGPRLTGVVDLNGTVFFEGKRMGGVVDIGGDFAFASFENLHVRFHMNEGCLYLDTLYGMALGNCGFDGSGVIDFSAKPETYRLDADIRSFDLAGIIKNGFTSDLNGHVALDGQSFKQSTLLLSVDVDLFESVFHDYRFHEGKGKLRITRDSLMFLDSFRFGYFENVFQVDGTIRYRDSVDLTIGADLPRLERYRNKLFLEEPAGKGYVEATITGLTSDPDLSGTLVSDSLWLYGYFSGNCRAEVDIRRFLTRKLGWIEAISFNGMAWSMPYDTSFVHLEIDSNIIHIDTAFLSNRYSRMTGGGNLDYGSSPMRLRLDSLSATVLEVGFFNDGPIVVYVDTLGFEFRRAAMAHNGSDITFEGRTNYDETLGLRIGARNVPAGPWIRLYDSTLELNGLVSGEAVVEGSLYEPVFSLWGSADSITYRDLSLGDLAVGARYGDRLLTIDSLQIVSDAGAYRAEGTLHADLSFGAGVTERFPDLPVSMHITASDHRFDLVSLILPSVEQLEGDLAADFKLSGTPGEPLLEGEAFLTNGKLKYFDLVEPIHADSAVVTMRNNLVLLDNVEAYVLDTKKDNRKRPIYLDGQIVFRSLDSLYYDVDVRLPRELPFTYELDDIQGRVEGRLHVVGDSPPTVTGDLTLISMRYLVDFAGEDEGSPLMAALSSENSWDLNLNIDIVSNYWIKNQDINAEFAGQMNVIREKGVYTFIGEMEILRGQGYLFDKTFQIEEGSQVIFEGGENLNARLDITGTTRVAGVRTSALEDEEAVPEQIEVGLRITGTIEAPEISPVDASLSDEDILPLITANYYTSDTVSASGQVEQAMVRLVGSQISQIGSRQLSQLGVETFEIDPYYQGEFDPLAARVTVGFYTASNLYVYGRSALSLSTGQEVGFEYRFNRNLLLDGRADEDRLYRLSLKLHWEF